MQTYVENPLAKEILSGKFGEEAEITVRCTNGELVFS
ncbi:hypothetical protein [Treponema sp.]